MTTPQPLPTDAPGYKASIVVTPTGNYKVEQAAGWKSCTGPGYNYRFNLADGTFLRWGDEFDEDPQVAPAGPELLDLEISINGCPNKCPFCYKGNTNQAPTNMSLETFTEILDRMPDTLTQIAFGITGVQTNPDFLDMLRVSRERGVVPNFTLSGIDLTEVMARKIAAYVGGLAVSLYPDSLEQGLQAIRWFKELGIEQTNVHLMVSDQTEAWVREVLSEEMLAKHPELGYVNAFIMLGAKPVGRAVDAYQPLPYSKFKELVRWAMADRKLKLGFDSCSAPTFLRFVDDTDIFTEAQRDQLKTQIEPCESGVMSAYINVEGRYFPCSFSEQEEEGVNVLDYPSFLDIWYGPEIEKWREKMWSKMVDGCRRCPLYDLYVE